MSAHIPPDDRPPEPALNIAEIQECLITLQLGHPLLYYASIDSTNTRAAELAREGAAEGTLIVTDYQTSGRGRVGRPWRTFPGKMLAFSLVLRPNFPAQFLVMASAVAVHTAVLTLGQLPVTIKWPNDILVADRKLCGILIESSGDYVVLGIGLNVNGSFAQHPELAQQATTLEQAMGMPVRREAVLCAVLTSLDRIYGTLRSDDQAARKALWQQWRERLTTIGRTVDIVQGERHIRGLAVDVDDDGALLVRLENGTQHAVTWGDVSL